MLGAVALGAVIAAVFSGVAGGARVIGTQAAPEVRATTDLYFRLNDMDAQVANMLLVGAASNLGSNRQQALRTYEQDRAAVDKDLRLAAAVAGSGPRASQALQAVLDGLGSYEAIVGQVGYLESAGPGHPGRPPATALALYRQATDLLQQHILPAAHNLTSANAAALAAVYQARRSLTLRGAGLVAVIGLVLAVLLVGVQFFITATHNRLVNPALAGATLVTILLTATGAISLAAQAQHLLVAKQDAFDSILALSQARALSYDANADESRYLVDPGRATQYQQAFETKSEELADVNVDGIFRYDAALAHAISAYRANHADVLFHGYFGVEFRNITFPGERAAAEKTLLAYQVYERYDRHLRALASGTVCGLNSADRSAGGCQPSASLSGAISFDTSLAPGNSNWAFYRYDKALVGLIDINQRAFSQAISASQSGTSGWTGLIPAGAVLAIIVLALAGVRIRLAEYR